MVYSIALNRSTLIIQYIIIAAGQSTQKLKTGIFEYALKMSALCNSRSECINDPVCDGFWDKVRDVSAKLANLFDKPR